MVAITLTAGVAVYGFVNGQARTSANQYGNSVNQNVNYLREHFVVVNIQFLNSSSKACGHQGGKGYCSQVGVSIYNNGAVDLTIKQIAISNVGTLSASGAAVPPLYMNTTSLGTNAYSTNPPTFASKYACTGAVINPSSSIAQGSVPPTVFYVTLPGCVGMTQGFLVGANYQVQVIGAFGNVVTNQVTASG
jgi:hypothetical protein